MKQHHSSSPLKTAALKIVKRRLGYDIYYITAKESERRCVRVPYSPPKKGGNFALKPKDFREFSFLADFAELKIIAVRIVSALNELSLFRSHKKSVLWLLSRSYQILLIVLISKVRMIE